MSYKEVLSKIGFDDASVNKMVGSSTLGYKQSLDGVSDQQIEDSLFVYHSGMGKLPCLQFKSHRADMTLVDSKGVDHVVPLEKTTMAQVAQNAMKEWATRDSMAALLATGGTIDVRPVKSSIAVNSLPPSISEKGSRKDAYDYLLASGLITSAGGSVQPAKGLTLFYDPPTHGEKREAIVITKEVQVNGQAYHIASATGSLGPAAVQINTKTVGSAYLAICKDLGFALSNLPVLFTVMHAESNMVINQHRLELGQVLRGNWKGMNASTATTYGLTQVQPVGLDKSPHFKKAMNLLGTKSYPPLDSFVWNSLPHTIMAGLLYHILYIEVCATSKRSVFLRYAGAGSKTEDLLNAGQLPTKWDWNLYSDLLRREITERCIAWYLQNK